MIPRSPARSRFRGKGSPAVRTIADSNNCGSGARSLGRIMGKPLPELPALLGCRNPRLWNRFPGVTSISEGTGSSSAATIRNYGALLRESRYAKNENQSHYFDYTPATREVQGCSAEGQRNFPSPRWAAACLTAAPSPDDGCQISTLATFRQLLHFAVAPSPINSPTGEDACLRRMARPRHCRAASGRALCSIATFRHVPLR